MMLDRKSLEMLRILQTCSEPLSSAKLANRLAEHDIALSERTIRLYLEDLEAAGLIMAHGKKGRTITEKGRQELGVSLVADRVGYLASRIDSLVYRMSFNPETRSGTVVVNTTLLPISTVQSCLQTFLDVFAKGYAMGTLMGLLPPGSQSEQGLVPAGMVGICTVCSITLNGVLIGKGVPVRSLFSGLLEVRDHQARRFVELIAYEGTSIDPLELFIRGRMTNYLGAIRDGNGLIGAGFREVPAESRERVVLLAERLGRIGLGAFSRIGMPNQAVLNIPVHEGSCGVVVIGGLNPIAVFEESDIRTNARAMSGLMDYEQLFHWEELPERLAIFGRG